MIRREHNRGSKIDINKINRADDAGLFSDLGFMFNQKLNHPGNESTIQFKMVRNSAHRIQIGNRYWVCSMREPPVHGILTSAISGVLHNLC